MLIKNAAYTETYLEKENQRLWDTVEKAPREKINEAFKLKRISKKDHSLLGIISAMRTMIRGYIRLGKLEHAQKILNLALNLETTDEPAQLKVKANLYNLQGQIAYEQGQLLKALECWTKTLLIWEQLESKPDIAKACSNIGIIHDCLGNFSAAIEQYKRALDIQKEMNNIHDQGLTLNNLGLACRNLDQIEEALNFYLQAQEANEKSLHTENMPCTLNNLANLYIRMHNPEKAILYIAQALAVAKKTTDNLEIAYAHLNQGLVLLQQNNSTEALKELHNSLKINLEAQCSEGIIDNYLALSKLYESIDLKKALTYIRKAYKQAKKSGLFQLLAACYEKLHTIYYRLGRKDEAYLTSQKASQLKDTLYEQRMQAALQHQKTLWQVEELRRKTITDPLTELHNREYMKKNIPAIYTLAARHDRPCSFAMLDLDHFKLVNDRFGHTIGDAVLCSVATIMKKTLRSSDLIMRYGGEEFFIVLPETNAANSQVALEKLRIAIAEYPWATIQPELKITASIGFSDLVSNDYPWDFMQKQSDQALYKAKQHGRNRVLMFTPGLKDNIH